MTSISVVKWGKTHSKILRGLIEQFEHNNIKYFIVRNYEGLPDHNLSKDVDILVEPGKIKKAEKLLRQTYKKHGIIYFYKSNFGRLNCYRGIAPQTNTAIHIDLLAGYVTKGFELYSFEELYDQTVLYNGIRVLNEYYNGLIVFIYKQLGYSRPELKEKYRNTIYNTYYKYPQFKEQVLSLLGEELSRKVLAAIERQDFDLMLSYSKEFNRIVKKNIITRHPIRTLRHTCKYISSVLNKQIFAGRHVKTFSVMGPDGSGKTTFLDLLIERLNFLYINDTSDAYCHLYHFRPELLPNLGMIGEKAGVMKQDVDFNNPHRSARPAGFFSSILRITYYWMDYVFGWHIFIRKDVHQNKFSIFDRYSYDLIVDPQRTRLNLPVCIRKFYVAFMPHPKIAFYLDASPENIYARKQELSYSEINRQVEEYKKITKSGRRFVALDSNRTPDASVEDAITVILDKFCEKL